MNLLISNFPEVFKLWKHHLMSSWRSRSNQPLQRKKSRCEVSVITALQSRKYQTFISPFHTHKSVPGIPWKNKLSSMLTPSEDFSNNCKNCTSCTDWISLQIFRLSLFATIQSWPRHPPVPGTGTWSMEIREQDLRIHQEFGSNGEFEISFKTVQIILLSASITHAEFLWNSNMKELMPGIYKATQDVYYCLWFDTDLWHIPPPPHNSLLFLWLNMRSIGLLEFKMMFEVHRHDSGSRVRSPQKMSRLWCCILCFNQYKVFVAVLSLPNVQVYRCKTMLLSIYLFMSGSPNKNEYGQDTIFPMGKFDNQWKQNWCKQGIFNKSWAHSFVSR